MFIIKSAKNTKLILCSDNEFHTESMVGIGGFTAKTFKTLKGAQNHCHSKKVIVEEILTESRQNTN